MVSFSEKSKRYGGDNESGLHPDAPEKPVLFRDERQNAGRMVNRLAGVDTMDDGDSDEDLSRERMDKVYDRFEGCFDEVNSLDVLKFKYAFSDRASRVKENKSRMKRKFEVALVTGDTTKLANNGDFVVPSHVEEMIDKSLNELNSDELVVLGNRVIENIKTPFDKKGPEAVLEEISLGDDNAVLTRLYNMTLGWKDKYSEDREYTAEEQKLAGIDSVKELVEVNPTALDFMKYKDDYLRKLEDDAAKDAGSDDEAYEKKMMELSAWKESAEELGRLVYGRQYDYAEAYMEMIEDAKKKKAKKIPDVPRFKSREEIRREKERKVDSESVSDADAGTTGDADSQEIVKFKKWEDDGAPVGMPNVELWGGRRLKPRTKGGEGSNIHRDDVGEKRKSGLYEGLSVLSRESEADRLHIQRTMEMITVAPGKPNKKFGDVLGKLGLAVNYSFDETDGSGLEPSYFYAAGRGSDSFYDFSKTFYVSDGSERRRALILYEPYSQTEGVDFNKVYYDPIVLVESESGVKAVVDVLGSEDGVELKTANLRTELKLGAIAESIFETEEQSIDLNGERKVRPESLVSAIYSGAKKKPGLTNMHKVIE